MQPLMDVKLPEDQMLLGGVTGDRSLSATSKKAYAMRLKLLASKHRKPILDIIFEANHSLARLRQTYSEVCTCKGFIITFVAAIRKCTPFALQLQKAQIWLQELLLLDSVLQQRYKSNLPTAGQAAGHVPWTNIAKLRDKLPRGPKARLLLIVFIYSLEMAPTRADCNRVALLSCCGETDRC